VVVVSLGGGRGPVVAPPERGRVTVQVGPLRTTVAVEEVRLDDRPVVRSKAEPPRRRTPAAPRPIPRAADGTPPGQDLAPARTGDATLDVRGSRVDEALSDVDRFVDDSLLAFREVIFVIHGHGTGALREAIREHLGMHAAVTRVRPGQEKEGGDGVTVVWLDV
jgi:DNA mismatch repair protein MutS2